MCINSKYTEILSVYSRLLIRGVHCVSVHVRILINSGSPFPSLYVGGDVGAGGTAREGAQQRTVGTDVR